MLSGPVPRASKGASLVPSGLYRLSLQHQRAWDRLSRGRPVRGGASCREFDLPRRSGRPLPRSLQRRADAASSPRSRSRRAREPKASGALSPHHTCRPEVTPQTAAGQADFEAARETRGTGAVAARMTVPSAGMATCHSGLAASKRSALPPSRVTASGRSLRPAASRKRSSVLALVRDIFGIRPSTRVLARDV